MKTLLKKKKKVGGLLLSDFKSYSRVTVIKILWCWHKGQTSRPVEQHREPRNPCVYGQMIFDKSAEATQWGKGGLCSKRSGKTVYKRMKFMKLDPLSYPVYRK